MRSYCGYQAGMLDDDIAPQVETIFQLVPESLGIFTMITRGLTPERDPAQGARKLVGSLAHYTNGYGPLDRRAARELLASVDSPMRFVFTQFPGIDGYTHSGSPDSPEVRQSLQLIDRTVGAVTARLQARGDLDDTLFVLVSDHGATRMHTHQDLALWFSAIRCSGPATPARQSWWPAMPSRRSMRGRACLARVASPWSNCAVPMHSVRTTTS